jgi:hypothetical protein
MRPTTHYMYCHVSQRLRRGFGLVIEFTGYLQVVTTNNYNTIADIRNLNHSTPIFSVYMH